MFMEKKSATDAVLLQVSEMAKRAYPFFISSGREAS